MGIISDFDTHYLVLDQGNTRLKITVFDANSTLVYSKSITDKIVTIVADIIDEYQPQAAIFSASGSINSQLIELLSGLKKFVFLDSGTKLPIDIQYKTPETLGVDRVANVCAAFSLFPNQASLVVDFGTCITYNIIDQNNSFLGGAIAPGMMMRAKAMNTFTENLPLVEPQPIDSFIGVDTTTSLNVGVMEGIRHEIQGYINQYSSIYPNLTIIFTGGDHSYFVNTIECSIFADFNLTAIGLNEILQYNL